MNNIILEKSDVHPGNLSILEHYAPIALNDALKHIKKTRQGRLNMLCNLLHITKAEKNPEFRKVVKQIAYHLVPCINNVNVNTISDKVMTCFDSSKRKEEQAESKIALYLAVLDNERAPACSMCTYHYEFFQACTTYKHSEKHFEDLIIHFFETNIQVNQVDYA
jgi:hypothetical protein